MNQQPAGPIRWPRARLFVHLASSAIEAGRRHALDLLDCVDLKDFSMMINKLKKPANLKEIRRLDTRFTLDLTFACEFVPDRMLNTMVHMLKESAKHAVEQSNNRGYRTSVGTFLDLVVAYRKWEIVENSTDSIKKNFNVIIANLQEMQKDRRPGIAFVSSKAKLLHSVVKELMDFEVRLFKQCNSS